MQQSKKTLEHGPELCSRPLCSWARRSSKSTCIAEAIAEFQRAIELSGHSGAFDSNLAYVYARSGRKGEAENIVKDLEAQPDKNPSLDANIALVYVGLGDHDQAMVWLNKAYEARFNPSILLRPSFDPLRSDARFKDLRRRVGLQR